MTPVRILAPSLLALACVSCFPQKADQYDTASPYGSADAGQVITPDTTAVNPVYDTPAAYEYSGTTSSVNPPSVASVPNIPAPADPRPTAPGVATTHIVVAGDTLSGISAKYRVPSAAIKQANKMTKDTVVLGRKMIIPAAR